MDRVTLCLQLLLLVLIPKQSDAVTDRSRDLLGETDRSEVDVTNTTQLQHKYGEEACRSLLNATLTDSVNTEKMLVNCTKGGCAKDNEYFYCPMFSAVGLGFVELVRVLLDFGVRVDSVDSEGNTALHYAAMNGHQDMCRLLLERGAKVDTLNDWEETPLHVAAMTGRWAVVKLLVERGADVSVRNVDGETVIDVARRKGRKHVAEWLDMVNDRASQEVDTKACNRAEAECVTSSVRSQNQRAILESGQQQGVRTAGGDRTEELDSVRRKADKDCGPGEGACRSQLQAAHSGDVDRAKGLAMCEGRENCTDGSSFPDTPQTDGHHPVNVDIASNNSRLVDGLAEVKAGRKTPLTTATAVMTNEYDQFAKELEDQIAIEFQEQITKKVADKIAKEFQDQATKDDVWKKVLEDQKARDDVWRKVLGDQTASDDVRRKLFGDQMASDDVRRKVPEEQTASEVWKKVLGDRTGARHEEEST